MNKIILSMRELNKWVSDVLKNSSVEYLELPRKDGGSYSKDRHYNQGELDVDVLTDRICTYRQSRLIMFKDGTEQEFVVDTEVTTPNIDHNKNPELMFVSLSTLHDMDLKKPANTLKYEFDDSED